MAAVPRIHNVTRTIAKHTAFMLAVGLLGTLTATLVVFGGTLARPITVGATLQFGLWWTALEILAIGPALTWRGFDMVRRLHRAQDELRRIAELDPLTALLNRRGFDAEVALRLERPTRSSLAGAALMVDLDHFKRVNDDYGHAFGDAALRRFAEVLRESAESAPGAIIARQGGEEFVVMLFGAGPDEAGRFAGRLREAYSSRPVEWNGASAQITVSIGLAAARDVSQGIGDLIAKADAALYEAKRSGRDRVATASNLALAS